jgi:DNA-binding NtrC family response regulator
MSRAFDNFVKQICLASTGKAPALILGEVGTGKRQAASTIHSVGPWAKGRFVQIDCLGLSESRFESELLGSVNRLNHQLKLGAVAMADRGTVFLHEIGELSHASQTLLVRLLETGSYSPVGSNDVHVANCRLVTSSSQDIASMVEAGRFRTDLYHKINTICIRTPSLRERTDDVELLANGFLNELEPDSIRKFTDEALKVLMDHQFKANLLELKNIVYRLLKGSNSVLFTREDVLDSINGGYIEERGSPIAGQFTLEHDNLSPKLASTAKKGEAGLIDSIQNLVDQLTTKNLQTFSGDQFNPDGPVEPAVKLEEAYVQLEPETPESTPAAKPQGTANTKAKTTPFDYLFESSEVDSSQLEETIQAVKKASPVTSREDSNSGEHQKLNSLKKQEAEYLSKLIEMHHGDKKAAAQSAGISLRTLYRKIGNFAT